MITHRPTGWALASLVATACVEPTSNNATDGANETGTSASATQSEETNPTVGPESDSSTSGASTTTTTTTDETTTTGGAAEPTCTGAALQCLDVPGGIWSGPVARLDDADAPDRESCTGAFAVSVLSGSTQVDDPGSNCDCSCSDPEGGSCSASISVSVYNVSCSTTCNTNFGSCASLSDTLSVGSETFVDSDDDGVRLRANAPTVTLSPSCNAMENHSIPPLELGGLVEICGDDTPPEETCADGQLCVEIPVAPFSPGLCVWAGGVEDCPEDYTEREVLYRSVEDTRACSGCSCGPAQAVECSGEISVVAVYSDGGLTSDPDETYPADGGCTNRITANGDPLNGVNFGVDYDAESPTSTGCTPTGGIASGSVTGLDPITVCCMPG